MKTKIIFGVTIVLLLFGIGYWVDDIYKREKIYEQNTQNFLTSQAKQLLLTKEELKKSFDDHTKKILDSMGIKIKNITNYTQTEYRYHDTIKVTTKTVYDSLKNKYDFLLNNGCTTLAGYINPIANDLIFTRREFNDTLDIFQYHDFEHKFLFIKWGRYDVAGIWSRCKQDTLKVLKNYKRR